MLNRLKRFFVRKPNKHCPGFVRKLQSELGLSNLSEFDFLMYIWWFCFDNDKHLVERELDGFIIRDIPQLSTKETKVSVVLSKRGNYEEHMHANSAAYFLVVLGSGKIILDGEKSTLGSVLSRPRMFSVPKGVYHGFEVTSETMVFVSVQHPPILEYGV